jgi:hypothetical protein
MLRPGAMNCAPTLKISLEGVPTKIGVSSNWISSGRGVQLSAPTMALAHWPCDVKQK